MPPARPCAHSLVIYGHVGFDVSTVLGQVSRTIGGSAYYAAMAAATLGVQVNLVSILGADFPHDVLTVPHLEVSASRHSAGPSAVFTQTYDEHFQVISFDGRLNVCADLAPEAIPLEPESPGAILLTTAPPAQQGRAIEWISARGYGGLIAIDTCLEYVAEFNGLLERLGRRIDVLFVNTSEYDALDRRPPACRWTIVKQGSQGASLFENGAWSHASARAVEDVRRITGAGDVFAGAFLAAILNGASAAEALPYSVSFATHFVSQGTRAFAGPSSFSLTKSSYASGAAR